MALAMRIVNWRVPRPFAAALTKSHVAIGAFRFSLA